MKRDWTDLLSGAALALLGLGVALYAGARLDFGTPRNMGPGFFPVTLGALLALLGAGIAVPAWTRGGDPITIRWGDAAAVMAAILIFGLGISRLGLVLACFVAVLIASWPSPHAGWRWRVVLAAAITVLVYVVFILGLRMGLPLWPRFT